MEDPRSTGMRGKLQHPAAITAIILLGGLGAVGLKTGIKIYAERVEAREVVDRIRGITMRKLDRPCKDFEEGRKVSRTLLLALEDLGNGDSEKANARLSFTLGGSECGRRLLGSQR